MDEKGWDRRFRRETLTKLPSTIANVINGENFYRLSLHISTCSSSLVTIWPRFEGMKLHSHLLAQCHNLRFCFVEDFFSERLIPIARQVCTMKLFFQIANLTLMTRSHCHQLSVCKCGLQEKNIRTKKINLFFNKHNGNNKKELQSNKMTYQHVRTHLTTRHITRQVTSVTSRNVTHCHTINVTQAANQTLQHIQTNCFDAKHTL